MDDFKRCTRCGVEKPHTAEYFYRDKNKPDGLTFECKTCAGIRNKIYAANNREKIAQINKDWAERNRDRLREARKIRRQNNREKYNATSRKRYAANPEKMRDALKEWNRNNRDKTREYSRKYYRNNSQKANERSKEWQKNNRDQYLVIRRRSNYARRARLRNAETQISPAEWENCLQYWGSACAICGRTETPKRVLVGDHWIPLSRGGDNTARNIIPLCHSRKSDKGGCNNSKSYRQPEVWLAEKYDTETMGVIIQKVNAYFQWLEENAHDHN